MTTLRNRSFPVRDAVTGSLHVHPDHADPTCIRARQELTDREAARLGARLEVARAQDGPTVGISYQGRLQRVMTALGGRDVVLRALLDIGDEAFLVRGPTDAVVHAAASVRVAIWHPVLRRVAAAHDLYFAASRTTAPATSGRQEFVSLQLLRPPGGPYVVAVTVTMVAALGPPLALADIATRSVATPDGETPVSGSASGCARASLSVVVMDLELMEVGADAIEATG